MAQNVWLDTADGNYGTAANWSLAHVPLATENVIIPAGSPAITSGFAQSGVAIAGFYVEDGYDQAIGDAANYLSIDPNSVYFAGTGLAFIDVNAATTIDVYNTETTTSETACGLYLLGSGITTLNVYRGDVGVAVMPGETAVITDVNLMYLTSKIGESRLTIGSGVTVYGSWNQSGGTGLLRCSVDTVNVGANELWITGTGAITTLNNDGATVYAESSGTIANLNLRGGVTDFTRTRTARTVTTPKIWPGAAIIYDKDVVTLTNALAPQAIVQIYATAPQ